MLPSRPRLQGWDPGSLTGSGSGITTSGAAVAESVIGIERAVATMPEARAWKGEAYDAAARMFGRSRTRAEDFSNYATAVGAAVANGAEPIGTTRTNLLTRAGAIEQSGELYVDDMWVVQIRPAGMTAEKAAELEKRAQIEQIAVNNLLVKVGAADDHTAAAVEVAAKDYGFVPVAQGPLANLTGVGAPPADDVPDPLSPVGVTQQAMLRDQQMSMSVREATTETRGKVRTTTLKMMDGSTHVIVDDAEDRLDKGPITSDTLYDKNGAKVYTVSSFQYKDNGQNLGGAKVTEVQFVDGTYANMIDYGGGAITSQVRTPDGRTGSLPPQFFSDPLPTLAGGVMSGLQQQAQGGIPMLTPGLSEKVGVGAKWGGPALGLAVATYHAVTAPTAHEACVAAVSGGAGIGGGYAATALVGLVAPQASPLWYVPVSMLGTWAFGYGGAFIGEAVCPK